MIESTFLAVILASGLTCPVTTAGIYMINKYAAWRHTNVDFLGFTSGGFHEYVVITNHQLDISEYY